MTKSGSPESCGQWDDVPPIKMLHVTLLPPGGKNWLWRRRLDVPPVKKRATNGKLTP